MSVDVRAGLAYVVDAANLPGERQHEVFLRSWFTANASRPDFGGFAAKIEQVSSRSAEQEKEASPSAAPRRDRWRGSSIPPAGRPVRTRRGGEWNFAPQPPLDWWLLRDRLSTTT